MLEGRRGTNVHRAYDVPLLLVTKTDWDIEMWRSFRNMICFVRCRVIKSKIRHGTHNYITSERCAWSTLSRLVLCCLYRGDKSTDFALEFFPSFSFLPFFFFSFSFPSFFPFLSLVIIAPPARNLSRAPPQVEFDVSWSILSGWEEPRVLW